jgi:hypothetical protein
MGGGRVAPSITDGFEPNLSLGQRVQDVEQVAGGPSEPIQPRDHQHVTRLKPLE